MSDAAAKLEEAASGVRWVDRPDSEVDFDDVAEDLDKPIVSVEQSLRREMVLQACASRKVTKLP